MRNKAAFRPVLEGLEQRWVPATIKVIAGNLYVSNQVGTLTVSTTGTAGQVTVNDHAGPRRVGRDDANPRHSHAVRAVWSADGCGS